MAVRIAAPSDEKVELIGFKLPEIRIPLEESRTPIPTWLFCFEASVKIREDICGRLWQKESKSEQMM